MIAAVYDLLSLDLLPVGIPYFFIDRRRIQTSILPLLMELINWPASVRNVPTSRLLLLDLKPIAVFRP